MTQRAVVPALVAGLASAIALAVAAPAAAQDISWKMPSAWPGSLLIVGEVGPRLAEDVELMSGGSMQLRFFEPGAIVPALGVFDAVAAGSSEAGLFAGTFLTGKDPTFALFTAVPFGPDIREYMAWMYHGGGQELMDEFYARFNIKSLLCGVVAPEASGWFLREINTPEDLRGLKMRFGGLGANALSKLGVSTQLIAPAEIYAALERGVIDATEFSMPALDLAFGFHQVAKYYYLPGWHQQSALAPQLLVNLDLWNGLTEGQQRILITACDASIARTIAHGEAAQFPAMQQIAEAGVELRRWSPEVMEALRQAWQEEVDEIIAVNEDFRRVWESLQSFREGYRVWRELGYLD